MSLIRVLWFYGLSSIAFGCPWSERDQKLQSMNPLQAWGGGLWTISRSETWYFHSGVTSSEETLFSSFSSFLMQIIRIIRQSFYFCFKRWWDCWCFLYWLVLIVGMTGKGGVAALFLFSLICHEIMRRVPQLFLCYYFCFSFWGLDIQCGQNFYCPAGHFCFLDKVSAL